MAPTPGTGTSDVSLEGPILLFDGVCNLCAGAVQFVIPRDRGGRFRFASLQSEIGRTLLERVGLDIDEEDETRWSMVLIVKGRAYQRSGATLRTAARLDRGWPLVAGLLVIPWFIRDLVYRLVAANRYRWFGKKDACYLPSEDEGWRFLDAPGADAVEREDARSASAEVRRRYSAPRS